MTYTLYDGQGRIMETGAASIACNWFEPYYSPTGYIRPELSCAHYDGYIQEVSPYPPQVSNIRSYTSEQIATFIRAYNRKDVVFTCYDSVAFSNLEGLPEQRNLRQRVSAILYYNNLPIGAPMLQSYSYAMHFSYDVGGNVQTLVRDYPAWKVYHQRFKRVDYDYDLISGKVNMLSYNRGYPDQFYQRYHYDDDNRITEAHSSSDGVIWKREAGYEYYQHGPLARTSIGALRVQGVDYAYTIQGWLKSINGDNMQSQDEMGQDGVPGTNQITAADAYATTLDYFSGDYKPIGHLPISHIAAPSKNLYNGNIPRATVGISPFATLTTTYNYDQLNRLLQSDYAQVQGDNSLLPLADYYSSYRYDPDGNLKQLSRKGNQVGGIVQLMDTLNYYYDPSGANNRLQNITDLASNVSEYGSDIKQFTNSAVQRYVYDATGNVIIDQVSGQDSIIWNLYNKVTRVRQDGNERYLAFAYDGAGQRYLKNNVRTDDTSLTRETADYYVRDAQGNILATYQSETQYNGNWGDWLSQLNSDIVDQLGITAFLAHLGQYYAANPDFKTTIVSHMDMLFGSSFGFAVQFLNNYDACYYLKHNFAAKSYIMNQHLYNEAFYEHLDDYYVSNNRDVLSEALTTWFLGTPTIMDDLIIDMPISNVSWTKAALSKLCTPSVKPGSSSDIIKIMIDSLGGTGTGAMSFR